MGRYGTLAAQALAFTLAALWLTTGAAGGPKYSDWGPAINLGCGVVNSSFDDSGPGISRDGLSLYFGSARPGGQGDFDVWVAKRRSRYAAWQSPQNLGPVVNSTSIDNVVSFSRDGHWMFFNSNRPGGYGDVDIWASYRRHVHDDFGWETPFNLGDGTVHGVNTAGFDAGASYFANKGRRAPLLFFGRGDSRATQNTTTDIWVAELLDNGTFGNAHAVAELNKPVPSGEQRPSIRSDGLEIFFSSTRAGSQDIWFAQRVSIDDEWGPPAPLAAVNTPFSDMSPYLSPDALTLYFASNRPALDAQGVPIAGCGGLDLYMTTRTLLERDHEEDEADERSGSD